MAHLLTLLGNRFSPKELTGLAIWLDAQDASTLALSGSNVTQWSDRSGRANHATQGTAVHQPKYVSSAINGRPALQGYHTGSNISQLVIADHTSLDYTAFTAFTVATRLVDTNQNEYIAHKYAFEINAREQGQMISGVSAEKSGLIHADVSGNSAGVIAPDSLQVTLSQPFLLTSYGSFASKGIIFRSGGIQESKELATGYALFNGGGNYRLFSAGSTPQEPFAGYIGEHLFYTRLLNAAERAEVTGYLKAKWGLA